MDLTKETIEGKIDVSIFIKDHTIDIKDIEKLDTFGAIFGDLSIILCLITKSPVEYL